MNAESIFAAAVILLLVTANSRPDPNRTMQPLGRRDWLGVVAILGFTVMTHFPSLWVGFVADDYSHILAASKADWAYVCNLFTVPAADRFFRPLGMISYVIDVHWAEFSPVRWHLGGVLLHGVNTALAYLLSRRLGLTTIGALFAAAFFGVHGSRPEVVTWVSARFDLVATLFVLLAIILFAEYARQPSAVRLLALLSTSACALLSKESAYVLPLMLALIVVFRRDLWNPNARAAILAVTTLTGAVFAYRWQLLGGIGGYHDAHGTPTILLLNIWLLVKALALRLWAVLFFPLNWTDEPGWVLNAMLSVALIGLVLVAARGSTTSLARLGLALVIAASLPVYHLLLIGPDLEKSRVVYLASAAFGIFLAATLQQITQPLAVLVALAILSFQVGALRHNLVIWHRVSMIHARACDTLASHLRALETDVVAVDMPNTLDGVYMLKTGLPECLEIRHGIPADRLHNVTIEENVRLPANFPRYEWNPDTRQVTHVQ
jgi:hypothetical protein